MRSTGSIVSQLNETRLFEPPPEFAEKAHVASRQQYDEIYRRSIEDPEGFWAEIAEQFHWFRKWDRVLEWNRPHAKWFAGGQTNLSYNCLDRQIERGLGAHRAILWEGEPGEIRELTFTQLKTEVCKFANVLKSLGVKKGDRVTIYMPMVPELAIAMLACARIGAPHSIIFAGFSAQAIVDRVEDADSRVIIAADGCFRRGKVLPLKPNVDEACKRCDTIETVVVLNRTANDITMQPGRDHWWHELIANAPADCAPEHCDAEDLLYILYTSGTTGKPKGIIHTTAGYMVQTAYTAKMIFDLKPDDVYWCTADIGWVTGHSYVIYGILNNGVTTLMYEGAPNHPDWDRFWAICAKHRVTKFYTAPTAIRAFMREGREHPDRHDLSSIKLLGTVGEPINPEAWMWYRDVIGRGKCPIVDTWWQTETGGIMITPLPGAIPTKPGSATLPFFGIDAEVVDKNGKPQQPNEGGFLCIRQPWPGMLRGIYGDPQRYEQQYWSEIAGMYFAGDSARRDAHGYFWIMGRTDDVIKVAGHRLGTMEIESALVSHPLVAEAAVVGVPHEIKGNAIAAFVTLLSGNQPTTELRKRLLQHVSKELGALARPEQIRFTQSLPKTRSGKIMRRLLREIATNGKVQGDTTTLEDFTVLAQLAQKDEA